MSSLVNMGFKNLMMGKKGLAKANNDFHSFNPPAKAGGNSKSIINSNELPLD